MIFIKLKPALLLWSVLLMATSSAADFMYTKSFGIILGEPTGITFKSFTTEKHAFDAALGWSLGKNSHLHIHSDYLIHHHNLTLTNETSTLLYYGIGAKLLFSEKLTLSARFPLGAEYSFINHPLNIFIEIVPLFDIIPESHFDIRAGIGLRFCFN